VVPSIRKAGGGAVVNVSSALAMTGLAGLGAYVASKWGVRGLTEVAALELGRDRIRVSSIHPGIVHTQMSMSPETGAVAAVDGFVIPRVAEPDEITRLVLFIASDEAAFSTGAEFIADGGSLLGPAPRAQLQEAA
jgi:3alpha(or 20beta)-hydroxysteroid dehydrogenase